MNTNIRALHWKGSVGTEVTNYKLFTSKYYYDRKY